MEHLNNLKMANYVLGALNALVLGLTLLVIAGTMGFMYLQTQEMSMLIGGVVGTLVGGVFGLGIVGFIFFVGGQVGQGKGRILQTILALMLVSSFPIGTLFAAYAIWVCWINEGSKHAFDEGGVLMVDP